MTVVLDLNLADYAGLNVTVSAGVTLVLDGAGGGTVINGASPALTVTSGNTVGSYSQAVKVLYGDVNGDGKVNSTDAALTLAGSRSLGVPVDAIFLDVDGDGDVDAADVSQVRSRAGRVLGT